jgi:hypothetical protein
VFVVGVGCYIVTVVIIIITTAVCGCVLCCHGELNGSDSRSTHSGDFVVRLIVVQYIFFIVRPFV